MSTRITIHTSYEHPLRLEALSHGGHNWVSLLEGEERMMFSIFPPPGTKFETLQKACEAFNAVLAANGGQKESAQ